MCNVWLSILIAHARAHVIVVFEGLIHSRRSRRFEPSSQPYSEVFTTDKEMKQSTLHVFTPAKKGKLSAPYRVQEYWLSPYTTFAEEKRKGIWWNVIIFQWFHFEFVGASDDCSQEVNINDSCVEFIDESMATVTATGVEKVLPETFLLNSLFVNSLFGLKESSKFLAEIFSPTFVGSC